jgi:hypothetical protein
LPLDTFCSSSKRDLFQSNNASHHLDELLRQATSPNEISKFLTSLEDESYNRMAEEAFAAELLLDDDDDDYNFSYRCNTFHDYPGLTAHDPIADYVAPFTLPSSLSSTCALNQRDAEAKERLKLKLTQRCVQSHDQQRPTPATGNKSKAKPSNSNIDELVRFIDGDETVADEHCGTSNGTKESTSKKKKKKKEKQAKVQLPAEESTSETKNEEKQLDTHITQEAA